MKKTHWEGKAREFFPSDLALRDAIPQLHTPPIEVVTVTSAMPVYLKA